MSQGKTLLFKRRDSNPKRGSSQTLDSLLSGSVTHSPQAQRPQISKASLESPFRRRCTPSVRGYPSDESHCYASDATRDHCKVTDRVDDLIPANFSTAACLSCRLWVFMVRLERERRWQAATGGPATAGSGYLTERRRLDAATPKASAWKGIQNRCKDSMVAP